ncbi:hypothetical protein [Streptomyces sp. NPDC005209]|uniref:hypothetical protein n=1 Tax=Streptomyces sp. NPDC005209 TaxID=3156715 RepID=UPI0033B71418
MPDVRELVHHHKSGIARQLTGIAARAGAAGPERLGRQPAVLLEGATALSTSLGSPCPRHVPLRPPAY